MKVPLNVPPLRKHPITITSVILSVIFQSFNKNPIICAIIAITKPTKNGAFKYFHPFYHILRDHLF